MCPVETFLIIVRNSVRELLTVILETVSLIFSISRVLALCPEGGVGEVAVFDDWRVLMYRLHIPYDSTSLPEVLSPSCPNGWVSIGYYIAFSFFFFFKVKHSWVVCYLESPVNFSHVSSLHCWETSLCFVNCILICEGHHSCGTMFNDTAGRDFRFMARVWCFLLIVSLIGSQIKEEFCLWDWWWNFQEGLAEGRMSTNASSSPIVGSTF